MRTLKLTLTFALFVLTNSFVGLPAASAQTARDHAIVFGVGAAYRMYQNSRRSSNSSSSSGGGGYTYSEPSYERSDEEIKRDEQKRLERLANEEAAAAAKKAAAEAKAADEKDRALHPLSYGSKTSAPAPATTQGQVNSVDCNCDSAATPSPAGPLSPLAEVAKEVERSQVVTHSVDIVLDLLKTPFRVACKVDTVWGEFSALKFNMQVGIRPSVFNKTAAGSTSTVQKQPAAPPVSYNRTVTAPADAVFGGTSKSENAVSFNNRLMRLVTDEASTLPDPYKSSRFVADFNKDKDAGISKAELIGMVETIMPMANYKTCAIQVDATKETTYVNAK